MTRLRTALTPALHQLDLLDGSARIPGVELDIVDVHPHPEIFRRMGRGDEFDLCELSVMTYLIGRDLGRAWTALPVVPRHMFHHGTFQVNVHAGITTPGDLVGRTVGTRKLDGHPGRARPGDPVRRLRRGPGRDHLGAGRGRAHPGQRLAVPLQRRPGPRRRSVPADGVRRDPGGHRGGQRPPPAVARARSPVPGRGRARPGPLRAHRHRASVHGGRRARPRARGAAVAARGALGGLPRRTRAGVGSRPRGWSASSTGIPSRSD